VNATAGPAAAGGRRGLPAGRGAALEHALAALPIVVTAWLLWRYLTAHELGVDFEWAYWPAARDLLHGASPYLWSHAQIARAEVFVYPAAAAILLAPLGLCSRSVGDALFVALTIAALAATLRALAVRDWRVYAVALLWWPVVNGWQTANLTLLLGLATALVWRHRDRPRLAGPLAALAISLKPFMWPLGLWLLATRRYRQAAWCAVSAVVINVIAWAVVGPGAVHQYLRLSGQVTAALYRTGYGLIALAAHFGAGRGLGTVVLIALSAALAAACVAIARRGLDPESLTLCVALMLVASPLVWNHYFALLVVPLAIARPRLGGAWLAPLVLWLCPATDVATWQALLAWTVVAGVLATLVREPRLAGARSGAALDAATPVGEPSGRPPARLGLAR